MKFLLHFGTYVAAFAMMPLAAPADEQSHLNTARAILQKAGQWKLLSLDPKPQKPEPKDDFHGWKVLGATTVNDANIRKRLLTAFNEGINEAAEKEKKDRDKGLITETGCFQPRHGISATYDGKTVELLICFECRPIHIFLEGKKQVVNTTGSPQDTFDNVLKDAKVPLGPRLLKGKKD